MDKVMVEGSIGALWRTYGDNGKVEVVDGVGGDRGGNGVLLPLLVGLTYQDSGNNKPNANYQNPKSFE